MVSNFTSLETLGPLINLGVFWLCSKLFLDISPEKIRLRELYSWFEIGSEGPEC